MAKCCALQSTPRPQRRINGLQLPLNLLQVLGWIVLFTSALLNFVIVIQIQLNELMICSVIVYAVLYTSHLITHLKALVTDPSERDIRKSKVFAVPEFDRTIHAHVIENGRCHLCNVNSSSKRTKHCSLCNKCVDRFDHHCKWLNNCVGHRNYKPFIISVVTALLIALFTLSLCLADIIIFLAYPQKLSDRAQNFVRCTSPDTYEKYCDRSIGFLIFLTIYCIVAVSISCALLHLLCFHIYIGYLGVSTYEYIIRSGTANAPQFNCSNGFLSRGVFGLSRTKKARVNPEQSLEDDLEKCTDKQLEKMVTERNVAGILSLLINKEMEKSRKLLSYDRNIICPQIDANSDVSKSVPATSSTTE